MTESTFVGHEPCPDCGSSDALAVYSSGVKYCYRCKAKQAPQKALGVILQGEGLAAPTAARGLLPTTTPKGGIPARALTEDTCRRWGYGGAVLGGEPVQVATYHDLVGRPVAQKIRTKDKHFSWVGDPKAAEPLYGMHRWRDKGRMVIITEGEIDCLTVSQIQGHRYPVVSLKDGADSADRGIRAALEWLEGFDQVILLTDQDEPGRRAAEAAATLLSPGKARIAHLDLKDANAMLQAGRSKEVMDAIFGARIWSPDGVFEGRALWERAVAAESSPGIPFPWPTWNAKLRGLRRGEILMVTAGSGIGKSTICRELALHLMGHGEKVGWVALEEGTRASVLRFLGMSLGKPLHLHESIDWSELEPTWKEKLEDRLTLYAHCGSIATDRLLSRIRFMVRGQGAGFVVVDHVTMAVSGREADDDRKGLDILMTGLRQLVEETGCGMVVVSHLKRRGPGAPTFEDGGTPRLSDLRGSAALEQISDGVVALARNQAGGDTMATAWALKNRYTGETGLMGSMEYKPETGRYTEVSLFPEVPPCA